LSRRISVKRFIPRLLIVETVTEIVAIRMPDHGGVRNIGKFVDNHNTKSVRMSCITVLLH
jgi:hypothetical protein